MHDKIQVTKQQEVFMLKPKSPQESFYGSYLYDRIVPVDHLLRKINQVVDFSFVGQVLNDRYNPDIGRPAEDPEFMLRLCLLQWSAPRKGYQLVC
jgi:transposase